MTDDTREGPGGARLQQTAQPQRMRRFYSRAEAVPEEGAFVLRLDGRRAMTPGRRPIAVAHPALAEAVAAEWTGQGEYLDPSTMPATRLVNSAIDGISERMQEVRDAIASYAATDLLYYRASDPDGLVARQRAEWDPIVAWAEERFHGRLLLAEGVIHVAQPEGTLAAIREELARIDDPFRLTGLHVITTLTGSALIALAIATGHIDADAAWTAAHVDEDWNISQWGADAEAMERRARRLEDFRAAALVVR